jgi:hypothetical protein
VNDLHTGVSANGAAVDVRLNEAGQHLLAHDVAVGQAAGGPQGLVGEGVGMRLARRCCARRSNGSD